VKSAHAEPGFGPEAVAEPLHRELETLARWLGLDAVVVEGRQALAERLRERAGPSARSSGCAI
jgi:uncharacterized protein YcaQ